MTQVSQSADERRFLARVCDQMEHAQRGVPSCTPFLSTAEQEAANRFLVAVGSPRHIWAGGFEDAERKVCAFLPDWQEDEDWEPPFTVLHCCWKSGEKLSHRDFLGSILGQGLEREKVGDILVGQGVCDILVFRELAPYLLQNLTSAGRAKLRVEEIPLDAIVPPEKQVKLIRNTVNSLRLDAVLSTGFSIARGKTADLIAAGRVELNHKPCTKCDRAVAEGDVMTCRGLGKCVLKEVNGISKKGRTMIVMERYL